MKKVHFFLLILVLLAIIIYEYNDSVQYQVAFNQSLKVNIESVASLVGQNTNLLDKFANEGFLNEEDYQRLKDNQSSITVIFQHMESIENFTSSQNDTTSGVLRSYQSTYIEEQYHLFEYKKDGHKDSTDELLKSYYTKLNMEVSVLLMESDSTSWHKDVKIFLHTGSTFITPES